MCGWANGLGGNFRESVIRALDLDILCLCETFLVGDEGINIEGFRWIGNNRKILSHRALRGSGGVGILIRNSLADDYSISVLDTDAEGILWVQFIGVNHSEDFSLCVCYLPPPPPRLTHQEVITQLNSLIILRWHGSPYI